MSQILAPLHLCLDTGDERLVVLGLSALQKLLSHSFVDAAEVGRFLLKLEGVARAGFEGAHLKTLQTVVTLLSTLQLSDADHNRALTICFLLHERGASAAVTNIASASLRQCLTMLLDGQATRVSCALLRDLCALAVGEPVLWLVAVPQLEQAFCLEMVETIVAHPATGTQPALLDAVRSAVCPMVHRVLAVMETPNDMRSVRLALRVLRIVRTLLQSMATALGAETEVLVSKVGRWMADGSEVTWHHAALLEVVLGWCATPMWLERVFDAYDRTQAAAGGDGGTPVFALLLRSVGRVAQLTWRWSTADMDGAADASPSPVGGLLDGALATLPAWTLQRARLTRLLVDAFEAVATAMRAAPLEMRGAMVGVGWPPLMGAVQCVLGKAHSAALVAGCVRALTSVLLATAGDEGGAGAAARTAVVAVLVKACQEWDGAKQPALLRVCLHGLLAGVRGVDGRLGPLSWPAVVGALYRGADTNGELLTDEAAEALLLPPSPDDTDAMLTTDGATAAAAVAVSPEDSGGPDQVLQFWRSTAALDETQLRHLVDALAQQCRDALARDTVGAPLRAWPANRLCAVLLVNAGRSRDARGVLVAALWQEASDLLLSVCNHSSATLRAQGLQSVSTLCTHGVAFECTIVASLQMLRALGLSLFADARLTAVKGVDACVRARGPLLGARGWAPLLHAVAEAAAHGKRDEVTRGFATLQHVVEELLPDVGAHPDNLLLLVHAIGCYALQDSDGNASLTTPALVWSLAHHMTSALSAADSARLWEPLLRLLAASARDATREEVRAGGLRTLFKMVELYHAKWPPALWDACCGTVLVPLLGQLAQAARGGGVDAWLPTLALAAPGFAALPLGPGLAPALRDMLAATLAAPVSFQPTPQKGRQALQQLLLSYASLLERAGTAVEVWAALEAPLAALMQRALAESESLVATPQSTSSSRFAHYFVLVDAVRYTLVPAAPLRSPAQVAVAARLLARVAACASLYSDATYRQAGVLYDAHYKPHTLPPLVHYTLAAWAAHLAAAPTEPHAWVTAALQVGHVVASLSPSLRVLPSFVGFQAFPPDPDPCTVDADGRRSALLALEALEAHAALPCAPAAVPLVAHVLGCVLQLPRGTDDLATQACRVFGALCNASARGLEEAHRSLLIDVAESALLTSLEEDAALAAQCAGALSGPLRSSRATEALLSVCKRSGGAASSAALAAVLQLVPHSPMAAEQALVHCMSVLRTDPSVPLLEALRALRLPASAWPQRPSSLPDDGRGLTHLVLLFHALVDAAACPAASPEARRLASLCLHDCAASLGLPPQ